MSPTNDTATQVMDRPTGADIEVLIGLHDRDVRSALRRVIGRSQEEDDLVQEVFTRLVVRLRQPGEVCVGAWLRGVAHNLAVDEIRRRRPVPVDDASLDRQVTTSDEDGVAGQELYARLVQGAQGLPHRQRTALVASLSTGGPDVASVATTMGVSVHAAESLLSRARFGLRNHLAMAGGANDDGFARVYVTRAVAVLATVAAVTGWLVRRWRATAVLTMATVSLTTAVLLPARQVPAPAAAAQTVAGGAAAVPTTEAAAEPTAEGDLASQDSTSSAASRAPSAATPVTRPVLEPSAIEAQLADLLLPVTLPVDPALPDPCPTIASALAAADRLVDPVLDVIRQPVADATSAASGACAALPHP